MADFADYYQEIARILEAGKFHIGFFDDRLAMPDRLGNDHAHTVAEGDGPVNALDGALRSALLKFYKDLEIVRLTDYKVRIVNSSSGTAARTRVLIESSDGASTWTTIGVNDNIIEASLQALVDSLEYALVKTAK